VDEEGHNPFRQVLGRIADKWSLMVVFTLAQKAKHIARFSELKRDIPGISQRMLTMTPRNLEHDGLISRHAYPEVPPRVEYELTVFGKSSIAPTKSFFKWLTENWPAAQKIREKHGLGND
jgi:DNA-binding HxlR family transcriptional regulator